MLGAVLVLIFAHFFADFIGQPTHILAKKWKSMKAMVIHSSLYALNLFSFVWLFIIPNVDLETWLAFLGWAIINGILHLFVDVSISEERQQYWAEKDYRMYFVMLGLDQTAHYSILAITYTIISYIYL